MQHIVIIGRMSPNGALANMMLALAAFQVNCMMLPIGCSDPPYGPSNNAATSPAVRQIKSATMMQRIALADVDQSRDLQSETEVSVKGCRAEHAEQCCPLLAAYLGIRRLASMVSSA